MRTHGYIYHKELKVKVLVYGKTTSKRLKLRLSGNDGIHLIDEQVYLSENEHTLQDLLNGKVIEL